MTLQHERPCWTALVVYRTNDGLLDVAHDFDELEDLQEIIERGPSWYALHHITIRCNFADENLTIEKAALL